MKIKRIFAEDMRTALRKVRDEHGPDAVILSNRKVDGGIEVISAIDYDESALQQQAAPNYGAPAPAAPMPSLSPRAEKVAAMQTPAMPEPIIPQAAQAPKAAPQIPASERLDFEPQPTPTQKIEWTQDPAIQQMKGEIQALRGLFERQLSVMQWQHGRQMHPVQVDILSKFNQLGLGSDVAKKVAQMTAGVEDVQKAWAKALRIITQNLPIANDPVTELGGIVALVGPTGVGKTTTVAKLAARYALKYGANQVALISTDTFRIGAHDQLKNYGQILGVPVYQANTAHDIRATVRSLNDKRLILIDTAGMSQRDMRLTHQFGELMGSGLDIQNYLVLSANTQLPGLSESIKAFRKIPLSGTIITKIDECAGLGGVLTVALRHKLPLAYLGTGQRVPEDLAVTNANEIVEKALSLTEEQAAVDEDILALEYADVMMNLS